MWLVDPLAHTLEAFALHEGRWTVIGLFQEQDLVTVEPFTAVALELGGCGPRWKSPSAPAGTGPCPNSRWSAP